MLSERQRNIVVGVTLAGRTAQYIADMFDCSISTNSNQLKMCLLLPSNDIIKQQ